MSKCPHFGGNLAPWARGLSKFPRIYGGRLDNGGRLLKVPTFWRELIVKCSLKNAGRLSTQQVVKSSLIMDGTLDNVDQVSANVRGRR